MPKTYSWSVDRLECYHQHENRSDVVFMVYWTRRATDGSFAASAQGSQPVALDPNSPFTPFSDLTEAQVKGWLEDAMASDKLAMIDTALDKKIEDQKNPPAVVLPPPWQTTPAK
jgi:hypothetical protein